MELSEKVLKLHVFLSSVCSVAWHAVMLLVTYFDKWYCNVVVTFGSKRQININARP